MSRFTINRCWAPCEGCDRCWSDECFHASSCNPHRPMTLREIALVTILDHAIDYAALPLSLQAMLSERMKQVYEASKLWAKH